MGVKSLRRICAKLIEHGMPPNTPAATVHWGTTPRQRTVTGTIADLAAKVAEAKLAPPALTIVGKVVSLRETLNWFERRPLFGQTVIVTRTRQQASALSERLTDLGANVIEGADDRAGGGARSLAVDDALRSIGRSTGSSSPAPRRVVYPPRLLDMGLDARAFGSAKVAAIGDATAAVVRRDLCLKVDLSPKASSPRP